MANVFTVDVEDYYQGVLHLSPATWPRHAPRLGEVFPRLLDWLDERGIRATMFVLGAVAETWPALVREAAARGHEIASHGMGHVHLSRLTPAELRKDLERSRELLEDLTGAPVLGFRAPYFSVTRRTLWALTVVAEAGFRYDSSVFPTRNPLYGIYSAPVAAYEIAELALLEFPPSTLAAAGLRLPMAGGFYLRMLPAALIVAALRRMARLRGDTVVYMHPWEFDGGQPWVDRNPLEYLLYRHGVRGFRAKLTRVVKALPFTSFRDAYFGAGRPAFPRVSLSAL